MADLVGLQRLVAVPRRRWRTVGSSSLASGPSTVASFEVFDSVLIRAVPSSARTYLEVHARAVARGLISADASWFIAQRQAAECSVLSSQNHIVLELIYREFAVRSGLPQSVVGPFHQLELDVEAEGITGVPGASRLLEEARLRTGRGVLFHSDSHLPPQFIKKQLEIAGCWSTGDLLWVSGVAGARERDGKLFVRAAEVERIESTQVVHPGDDPVGDRIIARRIGAVARPVTPGRLTEREHQLAGGGDFSAMCAGASRLSRLQLMSRPRTDRENAIRVGATVVGPFAASYAYWLMCRARTAGIDRVYFLSRDGEILHQVAKTLATIIELPAAHYLMGGRLPWQLAAVGVPGGPTIEWLVDRTLSFYERVTLEGCATRLGVSVGDLVDVMGGQRHCDEPYLTDYERSTLRSELLGGRRQLIVAAAMQQREAALAYLWQEGLMDEGWALADVGWAGSTVRALNALLRSQEGPPARVYFFGYTGGPQHSRLENCEAFVWDSFANRLPPAGGLGLVEAMCSGSHGPVVGYEDDTTGQVRANTRDDTGVAAERWWLSEVRRGVDIFIGHLLAALTDTTHPPDPPTCTSTGRFLASVALHPSDTEALVLGACPREEDAQGDSVHQLARAFYWRDFPAIFRRGSMGAKNLTWPAGALVLTPQPRRIVFRLALEAASCLRGIRG